MKFVTTLCIALGLAVIAGCNLKSADSGSSASKKGSSSSDAGSPGSDNPSSDGGDVPAGRKIFETQKCNGCPGGGAKPGGGRGGPDLSKVGNRRDAEYIAAHFRDPQAHIPLSRMPKTDEGKLSPDDLQVLADY